MKKQMKRCKFSLEIWNIKIITLNFKPENIIKALNGIFEFWNKITNINNPEVVFDSRLNTAEQKFFLKKQIRKKLYRIKNGKRKGLKI